MNNFFYDPVSSMKEENSICLYEYSIEFPMNSPLPQYPSIFCRDSSFENGIFKIYKQKTSYFKFEIFKTWGFVYENSMKGGFLKNQQ